jgi:hypothetical protein
MRLYWLKLLLLSTFVFWASGVAKYAHEALEHHGRDASVDDDDDDDSSAAVTVACVALPQKAQTAASKDHSPPHTKHPCPICQMLAAMVVDRSAPPILPQVFLRLIGNLVFRDPVACDISARFARSARGPPPTIVSI